MNKTFFKILVVVILAIFISGGILGWYHWWLPKKEFNEKEKAIKKEIIESETADWETMQSLRVGFLIKYPFDFWTNQSDECYEKALEKLGEPIFGDFENLCSNEILLYGPWLSEAKFWVPRFSINSWTKFTEKSNLKSLEDFINIEKERYSKDTKIKEETIILDNIPVKRLQFMIRYNDVPFLNDSIFVQHNEKMYWINGIVDFKYKDIYFLIFDKMFSTFKFLD